MTKVVFNNIPHNGIYSQHGGLNQTLGYLPDPENWDALGLYNGSPVSIRNRCKLLMKIIYCDISNWLWKWMQFIILFCFVLFLEVCGKRVYNNNCLFYKLGRQNVHNDVLCLKWQDLVCVLQCNIDLKLCR